MPKGFKGFLKGTHSKTEFKSKEKHPLWKGDAVIIGGLCVVRVIKNLIRLIHLKREKF